MTALPEVYQTACWSVFENIAAKMGRIPYFAFLGPCRWLGFCKVLCHLSFLVCSPHGEFVLAKNPITKGLFACKGGTVADPTKCRHCRVGRATVPA